jgi:hypothetical protein
MKQSFFTKPSSRIISFFLVFFFFISLGLFYNKHLPNKWFVKYSIDTNIKILATTKLVSNILEELSMTQDAQLLLDEYIFKKIRTSDTKFIIERFPNISEPILHQSSIIFYTNDLSSTHQQVKFIVNKIEEDIKRDALELLSVYIDIAKMKLEISKNAQVQKKENEIDYYNSGSFNDSEKLELFKKERAVIEIAKNGEVSFKRQLSDRRSEAEFELNMLVKNNPENFRLIKILEQLQSDLKNIKIITPGKIETQDDKKPSTNLLLITFSIMGLFFGLMVILLTSGFSKKLRTRMSLFLQGLK